METNKPGPIYRVADLSIEKDLEAIAEMQIKAKREINHHSRFDLGDRKHLESIMKKLKIMGKNTLIDLACIDEHPVGFTEYFLNEWYKMVEHKLIFVQKEYRNFGVGKGLLKEMERNARKMNYESIRSYANGEYQSFYLKNGFVKKNYRKGEECMVLNLK